MVRARSLLLALAFLLALPQVGGAGQPGEPPGPAEATPDQEAFALLQAFQMRGDPRLAGALMPPETVYRGVDPVCDLDGDGRDDLVTNDMQLRQNGRFDSGFSYIRAISGANGTQVWSADNLVYYNIGLQGAYGTQRAGLANPQAPPNVAALPDIDGDGVCDVFAYGFDQTSLASVPLYGSPSLSYFDVTVRVLSGADGSTIWSQLVASADFDYSEALLGLWSGRVILGFPTGFHVYDSADGPRFVLKTTDLVYDYTEDFFGFTGILTGDPLYFANLVTAEHLLVGDARDGSTIWKRDFGADLACMARLSATDPVPADPTCAASDVPAPEEASPSRPEHVNITWISGLGDLDGDGGLDVVMDQLILTNPRTSTASNPVTGEEMFTYGRGLRMMALNGKDGSDLWSSILLDPAAVQVRPPGEENFEVLAWTFGRVLPDMDGDGRDEPFAQYLAQEMTDGSPTGRYRTHFLRLAPADGVPLWDHPQQGWGHLAPLSADRLAVGTLDLPMGIGGGSGRFPARALRIAGIQAGTGAPEWNYEERFGMDSQSAYEIGLQQMRHSLAPLDLDGDGVREVVTPSRYVAPEGRSQVFVATARQTFGVLDGLTGSTRASLETWGPSGILMPCTDGNVLTFAVGHGRRMDIVRVDAATSEVVGRRSVYDFSEDRSALLGIDVISLDAKCALSGGTLTYGINLEAFSFFRRYEIIPLVGVLGTDGQVIWRSPEMEEEPPTPSLLETAGAPPSLVPGGAAFAVLVAGALVAGLAIGGLFGVPAGRALARRKRRLDPLGLALIVLVLPPMALDDVASGPAAVDVPDVAALDPSPARVAHPAPAAAAAPAPSVASPAPVPGDSPRAGPTAAEVVSAWSYAQMRSKAGTVADVSDRMGENDTVTFPHVLGDMDGDGIDDIALDVYCSAYAFDACYDGSSLDLLEPGSLVNYLLDPFICGPLHSLVVVSGANGDRMWDAPLDRPIEMPNTVLSSQCAAEAVVGIVPLPEAAAGILLYRYEALDPSSGFGGQLYNHTLFLRDGGTGAILWSFNEKGYSTPDLIFEQAAHAVSMLLTPMLVEPEDGRVPDRLGGAGPGLFVRGIGYRASALDTFQPPPGFNQARLTDEYLPVEWLASLDPVTGQVLWRSDSFQPTPGRSVLPMGTQDSLFRSSYYNYEPHRSYDYPYDLPVAVVTNAWSSGLCCGDLSGDGVFDPSFMTLEWSALPNGNPGPYVFDSDLVAFDGATGARLWESPVARDQPLQQQRTPYWQYPYDTLHMRMQAVGDANGDGAADLLLHANVKHADFFTSIRLIDGRSGTEAWRIEHPTQQSALALGDADGDGGNDLLFIDWYTFEAYQQIRGDYSNATHNPLRLRSGADGHVIYETATYNAPIDVEVAFANLARGGLPDLDGDGVGDYPVDDPIFLPDQVTLHQLHYLSGRTGDRLYTIHAAGAFAFTGRLPDLDGDGVPELALLSGDATDLWVSYRDGRDGSPLWGHRVFAIRTADYVLAIPKMEFQRLTTSFDGDVGFLTNFHMDTEEVVGTYESFYIQVGGSSGSVRGLYTDAFTLPQLTVVLDAKGTDTWVYPSGGDVSATHLKGESPGTAALLQVRSVAEPTAADLTARFVRDAWLPMAAFAGGLFLAFVAVALAVRRKGVPA